MPPYRLISIVINRKFQFSRCTILLLSLPWWNAAYPAAINDGIIYKDDFDDSPKERKKERKRGNKILFDPHRRKHDGWNGTSRLQPAKYLWYRLYPLQGSKLALPRYLYRDSVIHDVNFSFFFSFFLFQCIVFPVGISQPVSRLSTTMFCTCNPRHDFFCSYRPSPFHPWKR